MEDYWKPKEGNYVRIAMSDYFQDIENDSRPEEKRKISVDPGYLYGIIIKIIKDRVTLKVAKADYDNYNNYFSPGQEINTYFYRLRYAGKD